ncbi:MAG: hypothetical protein RIS76_682 [Verrucomicrobiota bacterium]
MAFRFESWFYNRGFAGHGARVLGETDIPRASQSQITNIPMGDKSPKSNQKKSSQKQAAASTAAAGKKAAVLNKQAAGKKK